jgi:hypothetical protein
MIKHYEHHSGANKFPTLEELAWTTQDKGVFLCPESPRPRRSQMGLRTSYRILANPRDEQFVAVAAHDIAIVAEMSTRRNGDRFVLFYDGTVETFSRQEFDLLEKGGFIRTRGVAAVPGKHE